jgi:uncharacterized protein YndB with AHSA1/START domain
MNKPFEIERTFPVSASRLWNAITDPEEFKNWYFKVPGFKAEVGYKFDFLGGPPDGIQYKHLCEVTEVVKERKLTYSWRYDGYEGNSFVTWELFPEGNSTRLKLTHAGLETFPKSNPDLVRKNFEAGWTAFITKRLEEYLARG